MASWSICLLILHFYQGFNKNMTSIRDVLAKNMKAYRKAMGFSQAKLAEKVDTSTHYIGMIEVKKNFPSPEMIERIAAAFGIDTIDLFSTDTNLPKAIKACRKATLKDIKNLMGKYIDDKLKDLEKDI